VKSSEEVHHPEQLNLKDMISAEERIRRAREIAEGPHQTLEEMALVQPMKPSLSQMETVLIWLRLPTDHSPNLDTLVKELQRIMGISIPPGHIEFHPVPLIAFFPCTIPQAKALDGDTMFKRTYTVIPWQSDPVPNMLFGLRLYTNTPTPIGDVQMWWLGIDDFNHRFGDVVAKGPYETSCYFTIRNATYNDCTRVLRNRPIIGDHSFAVSICKTDINSEHIPGMGFSFSTTERLMFWDVANALQRLGNRLMGQHISVGNPSQLMFWIFPPHPGLKTIKIRENLVIKVEELVKPVIDYPHCNHAGMNVGRAEEGTQRRTNNSGVPGMDIDNSICLFPIHYKNNVVNYCPQKQRQFDVTTILYPIKKGGRQYHPRWPGNCWPWMILLTAFIPTTWALGTRECTQALTSPNIISLVGLSLMTWNVAGLLFTNRNQIMDTLCKWGRPYVIMIQEAIAGHSYEHKEATKAFFDFHGYDLFMVDHPTKQICRVGLLLRKALSNPEAIQKHNSRMISIKLTMEEGNFCILSYYGAPKGSHRQERDKIRLRHILNGVVDNALTPIIGGDWNDDWSPNEYSQGLREWAAHHQLVSPHHLLGEEHLPYTWRRGQRESRLDFILMPAQKIGIIKHAITIDDENNKNIDHRPVLLVCNNGAYNMGQWDQATRSDHSHTPLGRETELDILNEYVNLEGATTLDEAQDRLSKAAFLAFKRKSPMGERNPWRLL